jgi:hypothetical protein
MSEKYEIVRYSSVATMYGLKHEHAETYWGAAPDVGYELLNEIFQLAVCLTEVLLFIVRIK